MAAPAVLPPIADPVGTALLARHTVAPAPSLQGPVRASRGAIRGIAAPAASGDKKPSGEMPSGEMPSGVQASSEVNTQSRAITAPAANRAGRSTATRRLGRRTIAASIRTSHRSNPADRARRHRGEPCGFTGCTRSLRRWRTLPGACGACC